MLVLRLGFSLSFLAKGSAARSASISLAKRRGAQCGNLTGWAGSPRSLASFSARPVMGVGRSWLGRRGSMAEHRRCAWSSEAETAERQLLVQHILVKQEKEDLLDELFPLILDDPSCFSELASQHSICRSAENQGNIGWISPGRIDPAFEEAIFAATKSEPVRVNSRYGCHIAMVLDERSLPTIKQMSVQELALILSEKELAEEHQFMDVREPMERQIASLPYFELENLYPLNSAFTQWAPVISKELDPEKPVIILCHHGIRSQSAAEFLIEQGFQSVANVEGGIDRYSREVDASVPCY